ncbi:MAG TPA: glycosyltransferase family 39 protein [Hyphomicrobiales bacterium]|nr:glycosyltransferase family 39 protein [Hyphomicrobiales bacterium]
MQDALARIDELLEEFLGWLARRPALSAAFLIALCLALHLPGSSSLPVTDRDEARFAQATKQMLETGDFIDIRFQEEPRYKKPIGIYWLQAVAVSVFSPDDLTQIWAYRIPSLIGIIAAVLLTWWAARPLFGRQAALLAAILLAGAFTLTLEARIAKSDGVLLAFTVLAMGALARIYMFRRKRQEMVTIAAVFWIALGLGILIKGPVAPSLAVLTMIPIVIFDKDRSWLKNLHAAWGIPVMLAITLPWFIAIGVVSDWEFFRLAFGEDFFAKLQGGREKHWGPPGFYFIVFWWSFWPATLVSTGGAALWLWRHRLNRRALFLLSWVIPFWLVLEATPTKLPHYAMVLYPAIAMGAAWVLRKATMAGRVPMRTYKQAAAIWLFVAALQLAFLLFLHAWFWIMPSLWLIPAAAAIIGLSWATFRASWSGHFHAGIGLAILTAFFVYTAAFKLVLPAIDPLWISRQAAELVGTLRPCISSPVILTSYREPSAVFLLGTDTAMMAPEQANRVLSEGKAELALMDKHTADNLPLVDPAPRPIACVEGFNMNGGNHLHLQLMTARPEKVFTSCPVPERYRCKTADGQ